MDEDVEAILNASDSEDDEHLNVQGVSLEDILREDDGGYVDNDGDDVAIQNPPHLSRQVGFASSSTLVEGHNNFHHGMVEKQCRAALQQ